MSSGLRLVDPLLGVLYRPEAIGVEAVEGIYVASGVSQPPCGLSDNSESDSIWALWRAEANAPPPPTLYASRGDDRVGTTAGFRLRGFEEVLVILRGGLTPLVEVWELDGGGVSPSVVTYSSSGSSDGETGACAFAREVRQARTVLATIFDERLCMS